MAKTFLDPKLFGLGKSDTSTQFQKTLGQLHEFYLVGEIGDAEDYVEWFDTIRNCSPNDQVRIYINSIGGDLYTTIQMLRAMSECEGEITCSIEGACMSAATMIFLSADCFEITPHSLVMFHNYSGGTLGKGGEQYDQIQFERKWSETFLKDIYAEFLTDLEIKSLLDNKDIWMTSEEVQDRLAAAQARAADEPDENTGDTYTSIATTTTAYGSTV